MSVTSSASQGAKRRTILHIEDNLANLALMEGVIEQLGGVDLIPAMRGAVGFELAREQRPDLVVLDLHLPDVSGLDVLARLKADGSTREIPVVVLTADASRSQSDRVRRLGAVEYLTKPIDVPMFLDVVVKHLDVTRPRDGG